MGILGSQDNRNTYDKFSNLSDFLEDARDLADKHNTTIEVVVNAKIAIEMERKNYIAVQAGDYTDEQAAGLGEILSKIGFALESLSEKS